MVPIVNYGLIWVKVMNLSFDVIVANIWIPTGMPGPCLRSLQTNIQSYY